MIIYRLGPNGELMDFGWLKTMGRPAKKGRSFWGPDWWVLLHSAAAKFDADPTSRPDPTTMGAGLRPDPTALEVIVAAYQGLLPCEQCRAHLKTNVSSIPIQKYIDSGNALLWTWLLHDKVNRILGKTSPSFDVVKTYYATRPQTGPSKWAVLHGAAAAYKPEHRVQFKSLLYTFANSNFDAVDAKPTFLDLLKTYPVDDYLYNNHVLFLYVYILHDAINKKLGKTSPTFEDVRNYYFSALGEECKACDL